MRKAFISLVAFLIAFPILAKAEKGVFASNGLEWTNTHAPSSWANAKKYCSSQGGDWALPSHNQLMILSNSVKSLPESIKPAPLWADEGLGRSFSLDISEPRLTTDNSSNKYFACVRRYDLSKTDVRYTESRDDRIMRESREYQQGQTSKDKEGQINELQHEQRLVDFDGITSTLPDCPKYGIKESCYGRDGEFGDGYLGEFKDDLHEGFGALAIKEKNLFVVGYFKAGALQGRVRYSPLNNFKDVHEGVFVDGRFTEHSVSPASNSPSLMQRLGNWGKAYQDYERQNRGTNCTSTMQNGTVFTHCN